MKRISQSIRVAEAVGESVVTKVPKQPQGAGICLICQRAIEGNLLNKKQRILLALIIAFALLFILGGCSPKVIWQTECTFDDYYRSSEPIGSDYMDAIERTTSGDLKFEDFPAELVIAERLKNSIDNVLCGDEFPDLNAHLVHSIHFISLL